MIISRVNSWVLSLSAVGAYAAQQPAVGGGQDDALRGRSAGADVSGFTTTWVNSSSPFILGDYDTITFVISATAPASYVDVILCQTNAVVGDTITGGNSWQVLKVLEGVCVHPSDSTACASATEQLAANVGSSISVGFGGSPTNLNNYFFCFAGSNSGVCSTYSPVFDIGAVSAPANTDFPSTPTTTIAMSQTTPGGVSLLPSEPVSSSPESTIIFSSTSPTTVPTTTAEGANQISSSMVTISIPPTTVATTTIIPTAEATDGAAAVGSASSSHSSSKSLPIGAIVGIVLGGLLVLIALLLLALFFLRRKHAQKRAGGTSTPSPEQAMLTREMHIDSFNTTPTEKYSSHAPSILPLPVLQPTDILSTDSTLLPIQHPSPQPYTSPPSRPYSGLAAAVPSPRRKPTSATMETIVSRNLSSSSSGSTALSPSSHQTSSPFETYHDVVPIYGDARHSPQIFTGGRVPSQQNQIHPQIPTPSPLATQPQPLSQSQPIPITPASPALSQTSTYSQPENLPSSFPQPPSSQNYSPTQNYSFSQPPTQPPSQSLPPPPQPFIHQPSPPQPQASTFLHTDSAERSRSRSRERGLIGGDEERIIGTRSRTPQTSYLSEEMVEEGMSEDEIARLEEEERRIDEAIAEAEERRRGAGSGVGRR